MNLLFRDTPTRLRKAMGNQLRKRRETLGLKRSAVAAAVGYQNLSTGSRRIAEWEQGTFHPLLNDSSFLAALGFAPKSLELMLANAVLIESRIAHLAFDVVAAERALLCAHASLLRTHASALSKDRLLGGVCSPAVTLRVLSLGGGSLSLAALTRAWTNGILVANTEEHGPIWLFEGGGSALSGAGRCTGVDGSGTLRHVSGSPTRFFSKGQPVRWWSTVSPSPGCLADVLARLGASVPRIQFFALDDQGRPKNHPLATYDPNSGLFATGQDEATPVVSHEEPRQTCDLSLVNGTIEGPQGWLPIKVVGPNPPRGVLPFLQNLLNRPTGASGAS